MEISLTSLEKSNKYIYKITKNEKENLTLVSQLWQLVAGKGQILKGDTANFTHIAFFVGRIQIRFIDTKQIGSALDQ